MKKLLGMMALTLAIMLPYVTKADTIKINPLNCTNFDAEGYSTCLVTYDIDSENGVGSLDVTLTEKGGATISSIDAVEGSSWTFTKSQKEHVWTVNLTGPDVSGVGDLFQFTYKNSGDKDCGVEVVLGNVSVSTPNTTNPDKPTDNKDTGSAVPFIALGTISVIAVAAYLATKNKTKMYKI